jgi:hypothetical protein
MAWGVAIAAPLAILSGAYALSSISDQIGGVGPLDRAAFGWLVVIPLVSFAPAAGGLASSNLSSSARVFVAAAVAAVISLVAAALLFNSMAHPHCEFGSRFTDGDFLRAALGGGLLVGIWIGMSCAIAAAVIRRGHHWISIVAGLALGFATLWVGLLGTFASLAAGLAGVCNRPF